MPDYSALLGDQRYDLAVSLGQQFHLDPSQVLYGYLQILSQTAGQPTDHGDRLADPQVKQMVNLKFDQFLKNGGHGF